MATIISRRPDDPLVALESRLERLFGSGQFAEGSQLLADYSAAFTERFHSLSGEAAERFAGATVARLRHWKLLIELERAHAACQFRKLQADVHPVYPSARPGIGASWEVEA